MGRRAVTQGSGDTPRTEEAMSEPAEPKPSTAAPPAARASLARLVGNVERVIF